MSVTNVTGVRTDIAQMLDKIREVSHREKVFSPVEFKGNSNFNNVMESTKSVLNHVNTLQNTSEKIKDLYISGDSNVSLAQVLVTSEKSKLAFEGLVAVRNKCLEAYKEIMNMPV